jgi:WD domain, G-beta repeat
MQDQPAQKLLDPIVTLQVRSSVASLCFVAYSGGGSTTNNARDGLSDDDGDGSSIDSNDSTVDLKLRCSALQADNNRMRGNPKNTDIMSRTLSKRWLASCHADGTLLLWDLARQKNTTKISTNREGAGLLVRRISSSFLPSVSCTSQNHGGTCQQLLYQTRDPLGIVSLHALDRDDCPIVREYETYSETFCASAPCMGDPHLLALPSRQSNTVTVVDTRDQVPISVIPFGSHGMVTSLAMSTTSNGLPILACGMESGSLFFHDLSKRCPSSSSSSSTDKGECKLSQEPILALDLAPSIKSNLSSSVVAVVGMAGDAGDLSELPQSEQGRIVLVKASCDDTNGTDKMENKGSNADCGGSSRRDSCWKIQIRARVSTCRMDEESSSTRAGKPGVSICRFQPGAKGGRLCAVGGWDRRVRLLERSTGALMAILRGHDNSVNCLDWAPDADVSGLLASSSGSDKRIHIWQCFGKQM